MAVTTVGYGVGTHDVILKSSDDASPTTSVSLILARDENKRPRYSEGRKQLFPTRQQVGPIQYANLDPERDLVFSQNDWSGGALQAVFDDDEPNKYAQSDGLDLRWPNIVTLGMQQATRLDFLVRNAGAEVNDVTMWADRAISGSPTARSISSVTTPVRSGSRSYEVQHTASSADDKSYFYEALTNPTVYQSREITLRGYVRTEGIAGTSIGLRIEDDSTGSFVGTESTLSNNTSFTYATVTRSIGPSANNVRIGIVLRDDTTVISGTVKGWADDLFIVPTGGVICHGMAERSDSLYGAFGRLICQWDETNDVWDAVRIDSANETTDIVEYNGNIFVSYGAGDVEYVYGSGTTWTVSNLVGDAKFAQYWTVSRRTLWKSRKDPTDGHYFIASSTNAVNGGSWSTEYSVGSSDREITRLFSVGDTVVVGKEDGLHIYLRVYADGATADLFQNVTNEFASDVDADNFSIGAEHRGWLYMAAARQSLYRYNLLQFQDITSLLYAPRLSDFGGRVRAIASGTGQLWLLLDTPTSDTTTTKDTWLISFREDSKGFHVHTVEKVRIGDIRVLKEHNGYVWAMGRIYNSDAADYEASLYRWVLPTKTSAPALDPSPSINTTGTFDTAIWDGNLPDTDKAFISLTIFTKPSILNLAGRSIVAKFAVDGASSFTTLGTLTGSGAIQTLYFDTLAAPETAAVGKAIQLQFELNTNAASDTSNPQLYAFALHTTLRPLVVRTFELVCEIGDGVLLQNGQVETVAKATIISDLRTLERQVYPIRLDADFDLDGSVEESNLAVQIVPGSIVRLPEEERKDGAELWRILLQEVKVAA